MSQTDLDTLEIERVVDGLLNRLEQDEMIELKRSQKAESDIRAAVDNIMGRIERRYKRSSKGIKDPNGELFLDLRKRHSSERLWRVHGVSTRLWFVPERVGESTEKNLDVTATFKGSLEVSLRAAPTLPILHIRHTRAATILLICHTPPPLPHLSHTHALMHSVFRRSRVSQSSAFTKILPNEPTSTRRR